LLTTWLGLRPSELCWASFKRLSSADSQVSRRGHEGRPVLRLRALGLYAGGFVR
jgi:hypothetical protein